MLRALLRVDVCQKPKRFQTTRRDICQPVIVQRLLRSIRLLQPISS